MFFFPLATTTLKLLTACWNDPWVRDWKKSLYFQHILHAHCQRADSELASLFQAVEKDQFSFQLHSKILIVCCVMSYVSLMLLICCRCRSTVHFKRAREGLLPEVVGVQSQDKQPWHLYSRAIRLLRSCWSILQLAQSL